MTETILQTLETPQGLILGIVAACMALALLPASALAAPSGTRQSIVLGNGLQKGDKIVTIGGIYGTVVEVKDKTLLIEVDNNVKIKVDKNSVVKDFSAVNQQ